MKATVIIEGKVIEIGDYKDQETAELIDKLAEERKYSYTDLESFKTLIENIAKLRLRKGEL